MKKESTVGIAKSGEQHEFRCLKLDDTTSRKNAIDIVKTAFNHNIQLKIVSTRRDNVLIKGLKENFSCPITFEIMTDPVITADGHSYERQAIEEWLADHDTSPKTGDRLPNRTLTPNILLKIAIRDFLEIQQHRVAAPVAPEPPEPVAPEPIEPGPVAPEPEVEVAVEHVLEEGPIERNYWPSKTKVLMSLAGLVLASFLLTDEEDDGNPELKSITGGILAQALSLFAGLRYSKALELNDAPSPPVQNLSPPEKTSPPKNSGKKGTVTYSDKSKGVYTGDRTSVLPFTEQRCQLYDDPCPLTEDLLKERHGIIPSQKSKIVRYPFTGKAFQFNLADNSYSHYHGWFFENLHQGKGTKVFGDFSFTGFFEKGKESCGTLSKVKARAIKPNPRVLKSVNDLEKSEVIEYTGAFDKDGYAEMGELKFSSGHRYIGPVSPKKTGLAIPDNSQVGIMLVENGNQIIGKFDANGKLSEDTQNNPTLISPTDRSLFYYNIKEGKWKKWELDPKENSYKLQNELVQSRIKQAEEEIAFIVKKVLPCYKKVMSMSGNTK